ncbi:MAG: threonine--tRNA ligase [Nanoarchaeota archaeon]
MKILTLHCDYITFQANKKAFKDASELTEDEKKEHTVKECLVILTAVESGDGQKEFDDMIAAVKKTASDVKTQTLVVYPYAHLSSHLAKPAVALEMLKQAESVLKKEYKVTRAPFGYYKTFELKCKGHPLSELSKQFGGTASSSPQVKSAPTVEKELTSDDIKRLLHEMNATKLDTSKLKDNDHRILGQRLELFGFNEVSPGAVFWHAAGLSIYNKLVELARRMQDERGYEEIATPQILNTALWKVSGHWNHYKDNMFITSYESRDMGVKPMNCPGAMLVYKSKSRSYKDLPLRMSEFGVVHRQELSGVLAGLFRVIRFTQDDTHIFCTEEQIESEIRGLLELIDFYYKKLFKFDYHLELSTRPEKFLGTKEQWDYAEHALESALKKAKATFKVNKGDGAFYGPKIDLHIKDSLGRSWQCGTIQLDSQIPARFDCTYTGSDGKEHTPLVIHRALFGSMERFIGILLEHTNGNLPLWLSPRQVRIINFTDRNTKAAQKVHAELKKALPLMKIDLDLRTDTVQAKVRDAELLKINYIVVVGDKEEKSKTLAVRPRGEKPKFGVKLATFSKELEVENRIV